jgi:hypothetical protein
MPDYRAVNRANWDERAQVHAASAGYNVDAYAADKTHLSDVVRFDRPLLGDIAGLRGIHLQCHIGTDTLSLARLGATMTGLDFSAKSLEQARRLPDIRRWAGTVALLRPGGRLFIREGHPVLWALDYDRTDDLLALEFPYFERPEPQIWTEEGTYVETDHVFANTTTHEWNHGLGEIFTALTAAGLSVTGFVEHTSVPWEALRGKMTELANGEWQLTDLPWRLPLTYTLQATRQPV